MMASQYGTSGPTVSSKDETVQDSDTPGEPMYRIGDLAREFGVTLRTLRFYEDRGLITPDRSGSTRLYDAIQRGRLEIALFGKRIGLSLGEIRDILDLQGTSPDNPPTVSARERIEGIYSQQLAMLEDRLAQTAQAIEELNAKLATLKAR